ncbi:hypothetical protein ACFSO7_22370 [Bacillus sp. CGMCC 1.16607]
MLLQIDKTGNKVVLHVELKTWFIALLAGSFPAGGFLLQFL